MKNNKNILVIVGTVGSGKTTAVEVAQQCLDSLHVPYEKEIINGFSILVEKVLRDDLTGGLNHYHPWCDKSKNGHVHHGPDTPVMPFIITGNQLWESMLTEVMASLSIAQKNDKVYFFELAGGINLTHSSEPASAVDHSFKKIKENIHNGMFSDKWFPKVVAVIHPTASIMLRHELNDRNDSGSSHMIQEKSKTAFVHKLPTLISIYGNDDFYEWRELLEKNKIPCYEVVNDGTDVFKQTIKSIISELFGKNSLISK